jgi:hypothetical protein
VEIVDKDGHAVSELKVGKFDDGSAHALDYNDNLDIEKDPDRFYIRVGGNLGNGQTVKVKLETVENPDSSYNDNATWVELTESGGTESKSQLLVSGDVDDDHTSSGYNLGEDDPSSESNTDRTHKVQLGGKVKISAIKIGTGNEIVTDIRVPVPVKKTVHVKAVIMSDATGVDVPEDIKQANERLAQVGVKLVLDSTVTKSVPFTVPDTDLVIENTTQVRATDIIDGQPQLGTKARAMIESFGTKNTIEDIHVFYVHGVLSSTGAGALGVSIREQDNSDGFANNFFVQDLHATFKTLAHELVHVLTNEGHWGTDYGANVTTTRTEHNLMRIANHNWMNTDKVREAKRLYPEQQTLIWGHRAVK